MTLLIRGKIMAETTKVKEGERETTWQVHSELTTEEAKELQVHMGRELWFSLETYDEWKAKTQERAGQMKLPFDSATVGTAEVSLGEDVAVTVKPEEQCAVCGHTRSEHSLPIGGCLGGDGFCTCAAFAPSGVYAAYPGEALDPLCAGCGHPKSDHDELGCNHADDPGMDIFCPCEVFVTEVHEPADQAETYPVKDDGDALAGEKAEEEAA